MHKTRLCNKFLREREREQMSLICLVIKLGNVCVSYYVKPKETFTNLNRKILKDDGKFWKTTNPLF